MHVLDLLTIFYCLGWFLSWLILLLEIYLFNWGSSGSALIGPSNFMVLNMCKPRVHHNEAYTFDLGLK